MRIQTRLALAIAAASLAGCDAGSTDPTPAGGSDSSGLPTADVTPGGDAALDPDGATSAPEDATTAPDGGSTAPDGGSTAPDAATEPDIEEPPVEPLAPLIGDGDADLFVLADDEWLSGPTALAFNPVRPDELWVTNRTNDSFAIVLSPATDDQTVVVLYDKTHHFGEEMSSIAFGDNDAFGTCQESNNTYNGMAAANDFMGPALWPADRELFVAEDKVQQLGPHLDMLHSTPFCMGIAWEKDNRYWAFNGQRGAIDMADFKVPHAPGADDHSDGEKLRFLDGELARLPGVPGHMRLDHETGWLYVADTGNNRILAMDTKSGTVGDTIFGNFDPGTTLRKVEGVTSKTLVEGHKQHLQHPSGLVLHGGLIYVSDHATGAIRAFTMEGEDIATLETGRAGVMGLTVSPDGELLFVDHVAEELVRVVPR